MVEEIIPESVTLKVVKLPYFDGDGDDANATFTIESTSPGIEAKFSNDGNKLIVNGGSGDISLKLKWDDNPKQYGLAVGELKVGGQTFKQTGEKGSVTKTILVGSGSKVDEKILEQGVLQKGFGRKRGVEKVVSQEPVILFLLTMLQSFNDDNDMQIRCTEGIFTPSNQRKVFKDKGRGTWDLTYRLDKTLQTVRRRLIRLMEQLTIARKTK